MTTPKKIEDGGPAFARSGFYHSGSVSEFDSRPEDGMSLRDWFAGQALGAIIRKKTSFSYINMGIESEEKYFARMAYAQADAMIAARKAGEA